MTLLLAYSVRHLLGRTTTTLLTIISVCFVTVILLALMMTVDGLERALVESGSESNLLLLRKGATTEIASGLYRQQTAVVRTLPGIAREANGEPRLAAEMVVLMNLAKPGSDRPSNVVVRGTSLRALAIRPQVTLHAGRLWKPGTTEIVVGTQVARRFLNGGIGDHLTIGKRRWVVVGIIEAQGTAFESEIWGDADQLMAVYGRDSYSSLTLQLSPDARLADIQAVIDRDPRLLLQVKRERDYYREKSVTLATFIRLLGLTFTAIFSCGAVLGGTMTLYGAVAARTREVGVLRALGFGPRRILSLFLAEAVVIGLVAGGVALAAGVLLQTITLSTMNFSTFSEVAFRLTLTPRSAAIAFAFALAVAFLGGLSPAIRASRMPVTAALGANGR